MIIAVLQLFGWKEYSPGKINHGSQNWAKEPLKAFFHDFVKKKRMKIPYEIRACPREKA